MARCGQAEPFNPERLDPSFPSRRLRARKQSDLPSIKPLPGPGPAAIYPRPTAGSARAWCRRGVCERLARTVKAARDARLLTPRALEQLLTDAIKRRQAADSILTIADRVAEAGIAAMPMEEIDAEVKAVRAERRRRAGGH
jgi:hypothetical protein